MYKDRRYDPVLADLPFYGEDIPNLGAVLAVAAKVPPLPPPAGPVVRVRGTAGLYKAVAGAAYGTTVLLADGLYHVENLYIRQSGLSLRSAGGNRDKVVLDGGGKFGRMIVLQGACDCTIADITVQNSKQYGIFMLADSNVQRPTYHNIKFRNIWVRSIKGTHPQHIHDGPQLQSVEQALKIRPTGGRIQHCLFVNDQVKPYDDDGFNGDYVSGIDAMWLKDWTIADNVFVGIRGKNGYGRGAIFIWVGSENVTAERNIIINCDRGICFGNPSGDPLHMTGGIVRNNFIYGGVNIAIEMCRTRSSSACNNTIWVRQTRHHSIRFYEGSAGGRCCNNLIHNGSIYAPPSMKQADNLVADLSGWFVNPAVGNLRLTPAAGAVGKGRKTSLVTEDFDRRPRGNPPTVGACEAD